MDKVFEKFGIYDFLGIWIPGALTITYYLFTLRTLLLRLFNILGVQLNGITHECLLIILYTAVAYIVGVILHELGKILIDIIPNFHLSDINTNIYKKSISKRPRFLIFKRIRYEYQQAHIQNNISDDIVAFDKAISSLKYDEKVNTKRIDTYHSIYALSRSLCLGFCLHAIILVFFNWNVLLFIVDLILMLLFCVRTYRYFHNWVKNVYLQYYKTIENKSKREKDDISDNLEQNKSNI